MIVANCVYFVLNCSLDNSCKNDTDDVFYNELHFYEKIQINVSIQFLWHEETNGIQLIFYVVY